MVLRNACGRERKNQWFFASLCIFSLCSLCLCGSLCAKNWPQWRGPSGDGVSAETGLPLKWSEKENVAWKCPLPGLGASTPAIWNDAVFVTSQDGEKLLTAKINKTTGKIEWLRQIATGRTPRKAPRGKQKFHDLQNLASPSPATDGERVIVHFGSGDLAAYDFAGKQLWHHNLQEEHGSYTIWWGHANSPVLYEDLVISVCMQDSLTDMQQTPAPSYVIAHDKRDGRQVWKTMRMTAANAEECDSYTTPILYMHDGRTELVIMGGDDLDAYDPATGKRLWYLPGFAKGRLITGPTLGAGVLYATQGMRGMLVALRPSGDGRLPLSTVLWREKQGTPDSSSPVLWKDSIFWITDSPGFAQCHDAETGKLKWKERLPGDYKPSPIAAEGRIYFLNRTGLCTVLAAAPRFEKLAENKIDADTVASPAVSDGKIYLRGRKALYCIGGR
jgi:outer membrane protein assembly factor BamB